MRRYDWNNDGRYDLVAGALDGKVRVFLNGADSGAAEFSTEQTVMVGSGELVVPGGRSSVAVQDLNGDGRDDLLFRGADGLLDLALSVSGSSGPRFEWISGPEAASEGLDLVATLDLDQDGAAEIVWWSEGSIEIWEVQTGL